MWRFFKKHGDVFSLHRLPGNYGCVLFNILYPIGTAGVSPTQKQVEAVWAEWRRLSKPSKSKRKTGTQRDFHRTVDRYSRRIMKQTEHARPKCDVKNRVALSVPIIRAYPLMLGFAGTLDSPYGGGHMTVCVGYEFDGSDFYVYVSDAHIGTYRKIKFNQSTYNDFIAEVQLIQK